MISSGTGISPRISLDWPSIWPNFLSQNQSSSRSSKGSPAIIKQATFAGKTSATALTKSLVQNSCKKWHPMHLSTLLLLRLATEDEGFHLLSSL